MAQPAGTIRTAVNARLVEVIAGIEGFSTEPQDTLWHVQRPPFGQLLNRRSVVIGMGTGTVEVDGIAKGQGPSVDEWSIECGILITDEYDLSTAEQACEDAYNAIADYLVATPRIGMNPGPRSVGVAGDFRIVPGTDEGRPFAELQFTITAAADIRRNQ